MPRNMPQAVVDTNVLVRALLKANGSDGIIFEAFKNDQFELLYSGETLKELKRVLLYKRIFERYKLDNHRIDIFIRTIITFGRFVFAPEKVKICRDPNDDELLSVALAIYTRKPIYIVSGDKDMLELKGNVKGVKIATATEFVKILK
ncbi:putative toxin-antitoxin system toxin component, PIN family [Candidatus Woesebacteria bacterium CG_4_10_14_0_2_um_filter_39_14]|uniref:Putative toxin-antitoxin system toxin component, PIN family n=2 Tax=Candidatus Woeseibacteriota TaxID=1752722 RepID=A0A2M7AQI7_9BACT|nr:MAG: putative toxin-antitoxin system toxin component, PIN family [Candidatus Woesebacteria bacterium CG06_land_8_20_14_3_00_39_27]PIZ49257.1 MAG: putative toxin-antitoxin system toxin component, PIN family [Candidatus Woesebacteria bacterium CG_4_10_14_0_2_um_filter_39_14]